MFVQVESVCTTAAGHIVTGGGDSMAKIWQYFPEVSQATLQPRPRRPLRCAALTETRNDDNVGMSLHAPDKRIHSIGCCAC